MATAARVFGVLGAALLVGAAPACGSSEPTAPAATSGSGAAPPSTSAVAPVGPGGSSAVRRVSANTASEEQIAEALQAAGVRNAKRWAEEVVEYRPYPFDDPNLSRLREKLAKYNPGQDTTDKIVSALTP